MPLIRIDNLQEGCRMALWQMSEPLEAMSRPKGIDFSDVHSEVRLKERLTEYAMLQTLTSETGIVIKHFPSGQPSVEGYSVSISHTKGWAAMIVSHEKVDLGIDIEYYSDRVNKVANRFIRPDEQSDSLAYRLINWSSKESVYKATSPEDLQYFEMRLKPFEAAPNGIVYVEDLKVPKELIVHYVLNKDYVLTWTIK